jgi:hypothetical protein
MQPSEYRIPQPPRKTAKTFQHRGLITRTQHIQAISYTAIATQHSHTASKQPYIHSCSHPNTEYRSRREKQQKPSNTGD